MKRLFLVLLIGIFLMSLVSADLTTNQERYYKLEEVSGVVIDSSDNENATNNGSTTRINGAINFGYDFESSNQNYFNWSTFVNFTNNFTINVWLDPEGDWATQQHLFSGYDLASRDRIMSMANGDLRLQIDGSTYDITGVFPDHEGSFYMYTVRREGTNCSAFVNSSYAGSVACGSNTLSINNFGRKAWDGTAIATYDGKADEVRLWSRALNQTEIDELYSESSLITLINPANNAETVTDTNYFVVNNTPGNFNLTNTTLYVWHDNGTLLGNNFASLSGQTRVQTNLSLGNLSTKDTYYWTYETCVEEADGSNDECSFAENNFTLTRSKYYISNTYYVATTTIGSINLFGLTVHVEDGITISGSNLLINGTIYTTSTSSSDNIYNITKTITIPSPAETKSFYFNFTLSDATDVNSTETYFVVSGIGIDNCSTYTNTLYNFTVYNEKTQAVLSGSGTPLINYLNIQIYDSTGATLLSSYSKDYNDTNPFLVCLESDLGSSEEYSLDMEVRYTGTGYTNEFYYVLGESITATDLDTEIPLYLLDNTSTQKFNLIYRDSSFLPVADAIIRVEKRYVNEGVFKTVEQVRTDSNGEAIASLELSDVPYNFVVILNGEVEATFTNKVPYCPNPTFTDCEIQLNKASSDVLSIDYSNIGPLSFTFDVNTTSKVIEVQFDVREGITGTVNLTAWLFDALGTTSVCSNSVLSSGGTISCTAPSSFGNSTIVARLYYNGEWIGEQIIKLQDNLPEKYGGNIVFLSIIIFLSLISIGLTGNPTTSLLFLVISAVVLVSLNLIYASGLLGLSATIVWFILATIMVAIKGVSR